MAIEPWFTGTAAVASIVLPPVFIRFFKFNGGFAFFASVILANIISEFVFRWAKPDFHYGPLYGLGIVMNVVITFILAGLSVAMTAALTESVEINHE